MSNKVIDNLLASKQTNGSQNRYCLIDLLKFLFSIAVVSIHTRPLVKCNINWIVNLNEALVRLAVPFFFTTLGFFLGKRLNINLDNIKPNYLELKRKIHKLLKMYMFGMIIYFPIHVIHHIREGTPIFRFIMTTIVGFFFSGQLYNSWFLWYLLSSIYSLSVLLLINQKSKLNRRTLLMVSSIALFACLIIVCFSNGSGDLTKFENVFRLVAVYLFSSGMILHGFIFIPIGFLYSNGYIFKGNLIPVFCFCFGIVGRLILKHPATNMFFTTMSSVGFFDIVLKLNSGAFSNEKLKLLYPALRHMSLTVYFVHLYVWTIYYMFKYGKATYGFDSFIVTSVISVFFAYIYWSIKNRKLNEVDMAKLR